MNGSKKIDKATRLHGLDFARFLAFAGMVFVNFHVMTGGGDGAPWAEIFLLSLEGKAAATFVVLAGIGLGIGAARSRAGKFATTIVKRALFLLVIGLLNALIFPADILHYYAVYFLFALLFIRRSSRVIIFVALGLPLIFTGLLFVFDYETGWNWLTLEYSGFWTLEGFFRNLLFNGWHPVLPWLSFLLLGIVLARLDLRSSRIQKLMVFVGAAALAGAYIASAFLTGLDPELAELVGTSPIPPLPLYMLAGSGAASLVIGASLALFSKGPIAVFNPFMIAGRQALTLYIAHIIIGVGALEAFGMLGGQSAEMAVYSATIFIIASIIYAMVWAKFFKAGPVEYLMRKVT